MLLTRKMLKIESDSGFSLLLMDSSIKGNRISESKGAEEITESNILGLWFKFKFREFVT